MDGNPPNLIQYYYKNLGLDVIMQPASPDTYSVMDSIFKSLEDELKITMD